MEEGGDGGGGRRKERRVERVEDESPVSQSVTRMMRDEGEVTRNAIDALGASREGGGEGRWSDGDVRNGEWRCGSLGAGGVYVGGCGKVNRNTRDASYFQCTGEMCKRGKAGKKKNHGSSVPMPHSSFTCGCTAQGGLRPGSLTFHNPSNVNLVCGVCGEERGEWDWEYGYNRGLIDGEMYLGRFNGERRFEGVAGKDRKVYVRRKGKGREVEPPRWAFTGGKGDQV
jgi:hypothetical protein